MSITKEQVLAMKSFTEVSAAVKSADHEVAGTMQKLLTDRQVAVHVSKLAQAHSQAQDQQEQALDNQIARVSPPSTEELAAQAAVVAAEAEAAVVPVVDTPPPAPVAVERKKIVREYQVRDEDGNPIGRPTHLEAWSEAEMLDKMQNAHENATRAFHRLKKQKLQFKETEQNRLLTPEEIKAAAVKALEGKDAVEAEKIVRGLLDGEFKKKELELQQKREFQEGVRIGNEFVMRHLYDFNPVRSNMLALAEYLKEHGLDFTLDNLEVAFIDLNEQGDKLAPVVVQNRNAEVAANPALAATPTPAPAAALPPVVEPVVVPTPVAAQLVVNTPVVEATVTTPVAANQPPATRRPGVNGGLAPGSLSASRPVPQDPALARKEFMKKLNGMTGEEIKRKKNSDPQFVKELASFGIKLQ